MGSLSKREKILLVLMAAAIAFYAYYSIFLSSTLNKMKASRANIQKYKVEVQRVRNIKKTIESQKNEIKQLSTKLSEALKVLPDRERNPEIAYNLKQMADADTVAVSSVGFGQPVEFKPQTSGQTSSQGQNNGASQEKNQSVVQKLYIVPVNLSLSGEYDSLMNYISSLEKDSRISEINTLGFAISQDGRLNLSIGINYFYSSILNEGELNYDFNNGSYGKNNLFK